MSLSSMFQAVAFAIDGKRESNALKMQAKVAGQQALADEEAKRRENRQLRGDQATALAESGLSGTGSSAARANQDAALAELDALNIRYGGMLRRRGLLSEAKEARSQGFMMSGQALLSGIDQNPLSGGSRVPKVRTRQAYDATYRPLGRVA